MEIKDFTEIEQKQIRDGLSTAEISDKEAANKILALVPEEWIKRIPFFVRGHATTKTVERIANQFPSRFSSINPLYTRKIPLSNIRNGIPKTPASIVNE